LKQLIPPHMNNNTNSYS
jgi:hypothetical protein